MIETIDGDLLQLPRGINAVMHQCNCFCAMGAGIAAAIARKWPQALVADEATCDLGKDKLGTFSHSSPQGAAPLVINLYSQYAYEPGPQTDYDAMQTALGKVRAFLEDGPLARPVLGLPHGMGCGLAGGDWNRVSMILDDTLGDAPFPVYIVRLPG